MFQRMTTTARVGRRDFLAALGAAGASLPYLIPNGVLAAPGRRGANERLAIGVIGTGSRVTAVLGTASPAAEMRLVALADCDLPRIGRFAAGVRKVYPEAEKCPRYQDYRKLLDKEKLDGVFVTTPTHARVLICIHALAAGPDVYAEKPVTLTIEEGQLLVKAVRHYRRVFQAGTQARSIPQNRWAVEQLHGGAIGKISKVLVANFDPPQEYVPLAHAQPLPAGLNWDMWCNQAPLFPCHPALTAAPKVWGQFRPFDGGGVAGGMTSFGTHAFDQIQWAIGKDDTSPVEVWPTNPPDPKSPVVMRYADGLVLEMMGPTVTRPNFGGIFVGSKGRMEINRAVAKSNPPEIAQKMPKFGRQRSGDPTIYHVINWIECVRSRKDPHTFVEVAQRHSVLCHLANIARDLGRKLHFDPVMQRFVNDDAANQHPSVTRPRRKGYELPAIG